MPVTRLASFSLVRAASASVNGETFNVVAPKNDGTNTNLEVDPAESSRTYLLIRNNSPYQIVYGYVDAANLDVIGVVLNPSDTAILTVSDALYIRSLSVTNNADVRVDKGTA
jgi:hypothetical protein